MRLTNRGHFHSVGQGLFHSASVEGLTSRAPFIYVCDCGTDSDQQFLNDAIDAFVATELRGRQLDALILSHFHSDHVSGLNRLLTRLTAGVGSVFLPYLTPAERAVGYAEFLAGRTGPPGQGDAWYAEFMARPSGFLRDNGVEQVFFIRGGNDQERDEENFGPRLSPDNLTPRHNYRENELYVKDPQPLDHEACRAVVEDEQSVRGDTDLEPSNLLSSRAAAFIAWWRFWFFSHEPDPQRLATFRAIFQDLTTRFSLRDILADEPRLRALYAAYGHIFGPQNLNDTSLAVLSGLAFSKLLCVSRFYHPLVTSRGAGGPPSWTLAVNQQRQVGSLLTGDLPLKTRPRWAEFARRYALEDPMDATLTLLYSIPHHGSKHNWCHAQAKLSFPDYVVSAEEGSEHHPSAVVVNGLNMEGRPCHFVNENDEFNYRIEFELTPAPSPGRRITEFRAGANPSRAICRDRRAGFAVRVKSFPSALSDSSTLLQGCVAAIRTLAMGLGRDVVERPTKSYLGFKRRKTFLSLILRPKKGIVLAYLPIDPASVASVTGFTRDMRGIGHNGSGDLELTICTDDDVDRAKNLIERSYLEN